MTRSIISTTVPPPASSDSRQPSSSSSSRVAFPMGRMTFPIPSSSFSPTNCNFPQKPSPTTTGPAGQRDGIVTKSGSSPASAPLLTKTKSRCAPGLTRKSWLRKSTFHTYYLQRSSGCAITASSHFQRVAWNGFCVPLLASTRTSSSRRSLTACPPVPKTPSTSCSIPKDCSSTSCPRRRACP